MKNVNVSVFIDFIQQKKWNEGNKEGKISVKGLSVNEPMVFLEVDNHLLGKVLTDGDFDFFLICIS